MSEQQEPQWETSMSGLITRTFPAGNTQLCVAEYVNALEADKRALESQLSELRTRAEEAERDLHTLRLNFESLIKHNLRLRERQDDALATKDAEIARLKEQLDRVHGDDLAMAEFIEYAEPEIERLKARGALADGLLRHIHRLQHNWLPYSEGDCGHCNNLIAVLSAPALTAPDAGKEGEG